MSTVYLSVEPQALFFLQDTLASLLENSTSAKSISVIGTPANELEIRRIVDRIASPGITLELVIAEASAHLSLALAMSAESGALTGALFIKSGVIVPYAWDARLEHIARHNSKIGTVSPLCDSFAMFSLLGESGRSKVAPRDTQYIDSLAFLLSARTYFEVPCFLEDCFYISPIALELAAKHIGNGSLVDPDSGWRLSRILSAHGYLSVLCDCLYVYSSRQADAGRAKYLLAQDLVQSVIRIQSFKQLRIKVLKAIHSKITLGNMPGIDSRPVQLHVQHSWGGGLERWVRDYCSAEKSRINLILKSLGHSGAAGGSLMLFCSEDNTIPLQVWEFSLPIKGTAVSHLEYANAIDEIIRRYSVDAILVSSFIGHSLDILNTSKPTILICHDYYPYCPAINITFDSICTNCAPPRLKSCFKQNTNNSYFRNVDANEWGSLREQYWSMILTKHLKLVAPSRSVQENLVRLEPRCGNAEFVIIPHGTSPMREVERLERHASDTTRLCVLVLGAMVLHKGANLLKEMADELTTFTDLFLVGCGNGGEFFKNKNLGGVIYSYDLDELPGIVHDINPDIALLLSVVPETFSYALSELTDLCVPVVATKLGSFAERIEDDITGFLVAPSAEDVMRKIRALDSDRARIARVKQNLAKIGSRSVGKMVSDYQHILPLDNLPIARFLIEQQSPPPSFFAVQLRYQKLPLAGRVVVVVGRVLKGMLPYSYWKLLQSFWRKVR